MASVLLMYLIEKLNMFLGKELCAVDHNLLRYFREFSSRKEIIVPWLASWFF